MSFTGYKNVTFKVSNTLSNMPLYQSKIIRYENGRRLWEQRTKINRLSRGDALKDGQLLTNEIIKQNFLNGN